MIEDPSGNIHPYPKPNKSDKGFSSVSVILDDIDTIAIDPARENTIIIFFKPGKDGIRQHLLVNSVSHPILIEGDQLWIQQ